MPVLRCLHLVTRKICFCTGTIMFPLGSLSELSCHFPYFFGAMLLLMAFILSRYTNNSHSLPHAVGETRFSALAYFYLVVLAIFVLSIVQILPLWLGVVILLGIFIVERGKIRADYLLLATFALFFGFTDNLKVLLSTTLAYPHHVFLLSSLLSQVISNVPAALLLADFTDKWNALLWGVSVGGFGSLVGSLANLIAYRLYQKNGDDTTGKFLLKFHVASYSAFFVGGLLYLIYYSAGYR